MAVIFPPWVDAAQAAHRVTNAGLTLVRAGHYPFVVIAQPDAAGFYLRALRNGALLVLDAKAARGCFRWGAVRS